MDHLNSKIHAKYTDLKRQKRLADEDWTRRREADIADFHSAVEAVELLNRENNRLREELISAHEERDSVLEERDSFRDLLVEERRKTKELSEEVVTLQNLLLERSTNKDGGVQKTPRASPRVTRSRTKGSAGILTPKSLTRHNEVVTVEPTSLPKDNYQTKVVVPDCCRGNTTSSGEVEGICVFQTLFELLLEMQFSVDSQNEGPCLSAVHQMSGYTFTLTWLRREDGDGEFRYHVSSLGTLERVALEWMKEDVIFSRSMWPVFFERMSQAIGRR